MVYEADLFPPIGGSVKIEEMEAGPELDALVAEKVMGHKVHFDKDELGALDFWIDDDTGEVVEKYSTDIAAAWQVVDKLKGDPQAHLVMAYQESSSEWLIWLGPSGKAAAAATAPLAICLAALKAVEP